MPGRRRREPLCPGLPRTIWPTTFPTTVDATTEPVHAHIRLPTWWDIIDDADIVGAWDFIWPGHVTREDAFKDFVHGATFGVEAGDPGWSADGVRFGGSGCIKTPLPEVNLSELCAILDFADVTQNNASLDAAFSVYLDSGHYCYQWGWDGDIIRWSCGEGDSGTVESPGLPLDGILSCNGPDFYIDNNLRGTVPDAGLAIVNGMNFYLGALFVGNLTQFAKFTARRLLLVKRLLTPTELQEIYNRLLGVNVTYDGDPVTHEGDPVEYHG